MKPPQVYTCSHPEPPSLLPPCTIPLGRLSAPAPSIQYHALNLDWQFISYMILYMLQCHSPKSSHPLTLPQSPKDCSMHLCLFCCLAYRVIITIFLNSTYMCYTVHCNQMLYYFCTKPWIFTLVRIKTVLMRWTKLEPIIQRKEKHQYSILTDIYGI